MMTLVELNEILKQSGYPVAYRFFNTKQTPPFVCYLVSYTNNQSADNVPWKKINHIQIELYTKNKDLDAEKKIEDLLTNAGLFFNAEETYIDTEKVSQRIYEIEV